MKSLADSDRKLISMEYTVNNLQHQSNKMDIMMKEIERVSLDCFLHKILFVTLNADTVERITCLDDEGNGPCQNEYDTTTNL